VVPKVSVLNIPVMTLILWLRDTDIPRVESVNAKRIRVVQISTLVIFGVEWKLFKFFELTCNLITSSVFERCRR
jgi:hypothetical protein